MSPQYFLFPTWLITQRRPLIKRLTGINLSSAIINLFRPRHWNACTESGPPFSRPTAKNGVEWNSTEWRFFESIVFWVGLGSVGLKLKIIYAYMWLLVLYVVIGWRIFYPVLSVFVEFCYFDFQLLFFIIWIISLQNENFCLNLLQYAHFFDPYILAFN